MSKDNRYNILYTLRLTAGFILVFLFTQSNYAQSKVSSDKTAEYYVKNILLGSGVEVSNVKHFGRIGGLGLFHADKSSVGLDSGLVMSTGNVNEVFTRNTTGKFTSSGIMPDKNDSTITFVKNDKDLNNLCKKKTTDVSIIEFDFIPQKNTIEFNYVFGSDEYIEFVGSHYNDVFGFFVSGPGIKKKLNLATLQDGITPITINTINHQTHSEYFRKNYKSSGLFGDFFWSKKKKAAFKQLHDNLQFDGLTIVMKAKCDVIPLRTYHIKIAIGDVSDAAMDSGVFLEAGSFCSLKDSTGKFHKELVKIESGILPEKEAPKTEETTSLPKVEIDDAFEFTDILFDFDSFELTDSAKLKLTEMSVYLTKNPNLTCTIYGYTDNQGSRKYNQELSEKRAISVMNFLSEANINSTRLKYIGMNYERPKYSNEEEKGRARNRRVELVLQEIE